VIALSATGVAVQDPEILAREPVGHEIGSASSEVTVTL
jgi:hypothetical protein